MKRIGIARVPGQQATTAHYFERAARAAGYDVVAVASLDKRIAQNALDYVIVIDPFVDDPHDLRTLPCPSICYLIDVHLGLEARLAYARYFDHVFIAQRDYLGSFAALPHQSVHWLPLACDPEVHFEPGQERVYEVGFVGNVGKPNSGRHATLTRVLEAFQTNNTARRYSPREMGYVYSRSKIVVNKSINGDVNMRVFEGLASGALLLTDRIANGLDEIGTDGEHFVTYESAADAVDKVRHYLAHEQAREEIARRGQQRVFERHSYRHRLDAMLSIAAADGGGHGAPARSAPDRLERVWRSECLRLRRAPLGDVASLLADGHVSARVLSNSARAVMRGLDRSLGRAWSRISDGAQAAAMKTRVLLRSSATDRPALSETVDLVKKRWWQKSFSQFGEDIVVGAFFRDLNTGFYVDVGSFHPRRYSNTHALHRRGWRGVNIDISPGKKALFDFDRPRDQNVYCAVSDRSGELIAYVFGDDSALNTIDRPTAEVWSKYFGLPYEEVPIPTHTLMEILERCGLPRIDYLNIDVEGAEPAVLKGLDFSKYRPQCVSVEVHGNLDAAIGSEAYGILLDNGYELHSWLRPTLIFTLKDFT